VSHQMCSIKFGCAWFTPAQVTLKTLFPAANIGQLVARRPTMLREYLNLSHSLTDLMPVPMHMLPSTFHSMLREYRPVSIT
jgi:hypothetical protein